jgi:hypothetical protein
MPSKNEKLRKILYMEQKNKLFESLIMRLRKRVGCAAFLILSLPIYYSPIRSSDGRRC